MGFQGKKREFGCRVCGQIVVTKHPLQATCLDPACVSERKKWAKYRWIRGGRSSKAAAHNHDRPWCDGSLYSLLEEIDVCGMSLSDYAEMFNRPIHQIPKQLERARAIGKKELLRIEQQRQEERSLQQKKMQAAG